MASLWVTQIGSLDRRSVLSPLIQSSTDDTGSNNNPPSRRHGAPRDKGRARGQLSGARLVWRMFCPGGENGDELGTGCRWGQGGGLDQAPTQTRPSNYSPHSWMSSFIEAEIQCALVFTEVSFLFRTLTVSELLLLLLTPPFRKCLLDCLWCHKGHSHISLLVVLFALTHQQKVQQSLRFSRKLKKQKTSVWL